MSDKDGNHGAPREPNGTNPTILMVLITVLTAGLVFLNRGSHDFSGNTILLALLGLAGNQLVVARRSEHARKSLTEEISDTRHLVRNVLNTKSLATSEETQQQLSTIIRTVAEEVRIAEKDQFWNDPKNREQLRQWFKELNEEYREATANQIAEALRVYHREQWGQELEVPKILETEQP